MNTAPQQHALLEGEVEETFANAIASIRSVLKQSTDACLGKIEQAIRMANREQAIAAVNQMFDELHGFEIIHGDSSLNALGINVRTVNCLQAEGIRTVAACCQHSAEYLATISRLGPKAIAELRRALDRHGFALRKA